MSDNQSQNAQNAAAPLVGSRRRFLRRAAVVGIGSATALLMPLGVAAEEKDDKERDKRKPTATPTATSTPRATATATAAATASATPAPTASATATPRPTSTPIPPPAARPAGDEDDSLDGGEIYGAAQPRRRPVPHRATRPSRWRYIRIDHANRGVGQTLLTSPDPDAALVVSNTAGAGVVGESDGLAAAGAAGVVGSAARAPGVLGVSASAEGVRGESDTHIGVVGRSDGGLMGVQGYSTTAIGVQGVALGSIGVHGINGELEPAPPGPPGLPPQIGVVGESVHGIGVQGQSKHSNATQGVSQRGIGVRGISEHGPVAVEGINNATAADGGPALGVQGISAQGIGVKGSSTASLGVQGYTSAGPVAVQGIAETGVGVDGITNGSAPALQGYSRSGPGVWAVGANYGAHAESASGVGVDGFSATGVGVAARAPEGVGLQIVGRIQSDASGRGLIPGGAASAVVGNARCRPDSTVLVTLLGDPGSGVSVSHVVRSAGSFEVRLTAPATSDVPFGYLVLD